MQRPAASNQRSAFPDRRQGNGHPLDEVSPGSVVGATDGGLNLVKGGFLFIDLINMKHGFIIILSIRQ